MKGIPIRVDRRALPLMLGLLLGCSSTDPVVERISAERATAGAITVSDAFGLVPFNDAPLPVYLHISNSGEDPDTLLGVSAGGGLPEPILHGAGMAVVGRLVVPAEGELRLEPGGRHLMFEPPLPEIVRGDSVELTLSFSHGGTLKLWAWILDYDEADQLR